MAKTNKKRVLMPSGIRNKLMAAVAMLLVSSIMAVSSTYAWFTLSTAPEVKNISTTVAGNGSLEIALMPGDGLLGSIRNGTASAANGGTTAVTTANTTWGNIIQLNDSSYGLSNVNLYPAVLNLAEGNQTAFANAANPLSVAEYGYDGRVDSLTASTVLKSYNSGTFSGTDYGVRAIGELSNDIGTEKLSTTYGYVVDLALRLNTAQNDGAAGKLLLQTDGAQRVYADSTNTETLGGGSYMSIQENSTGVNVVDVMNAIRVTFVKDFGRSGGDTPPVILGTAKLDVDNRTATPEGVKAKLNLYDASGNKLEDDDAVLLSEMTKNKPYQISVIVWLDGTAVKNSSVSAIRTALAQATLNLQFATDITLVPSTNSALKGGN